MATMDCSITGGPAAPEASADASGRTDEIRHLRNLKPLQDRHTQTGSLRQRTVRRIRNLDRPPCGLLADNRPLLRIAKYSDIFFVAPLYERRKTPVADRRYSSGCHYILQSSIGWSEPCGFDCKTCQVRESYVCWTRETVKVIIPCGSRTLATYDSEGY